VTQRVDIQVADSGAADDLSYVGMASFRAAYEGTCSAQELTDHLQQNFSAAVIREQINSPCCTYVLVTVDGLPGAFAKLRDGDVPGAIPDRPALEVQQFYVAPTQQRLGLGGRLMTAVLDVANERSIAGVWLSVWENADWATSFYLRHGFEQVGTTKFVMGSTVHNDFLLWRPATRNDED